MSTWRDEYTAALQQRDLKEKSSYAPLTSELMDAFTKLLDRTSALEACQAANVPPSTSSPTLPSHSMQGDTQLRISLAEALRSNGQLQTRVKTSEAEARRLRTRKEADAKSIEALSRERDTFLRRFRDRDNELREKKAHFDNIQDEMISLNLQLHMAEEKVKKVAADNKELIERWMDLKAKEAEEMNAHHGQQSE